MDNKKYDAAPAAGNEERGQTALITDQLGLDRDTYEPAIDDYLEERHFAKVSAFLTSVLEVPATEEGCPTDEDLSLFAIGELTNPDEFLVDHHVRACGECRAKVRSKQHDRAKRTETKVGGK